jgi:hypothetical protein
MTELGSREIKSIQPGNSIRESRIPTNAPAAMRMQGGRRDEELPE